MKIIFGICLVLSFGALFAHAQSLSGLITPELQQQVQTSLLGNPALLASVLTFLSQNGISVNDLASGNIQALLTPALIEKFKQFALVHPEILAFVQSLGLTIPSAKDIDWSQVLQIGIQVLPTIISILGKRDVSQEQVAQLIEQLKLSWSNILQVTLQVAPLVVSGKRDVSQEQVAQLIEQLKLSWSNILQVTLQVAPLVVSGK